MKNLLKIAINVVASLFVVLSGTMQAAKGDEVWLDFSVPDPDVAIAAPTSTASNTQRSGLGGADRIPNQSANSSSAFERSMQASEKTAKHFALDFNAPDADSAPIIVVPEFSAPTEPSYSKPSIKNPLLPPPSAKSLHQKVTALRRAIVGQESAGKFWIINPGSETSEYNQLKRVMCTTHSTMHQQREFDDVDGLHNNARLCAFLDTISWAETGTTNRSSSYTYIVFRGAYAFKDFSTHPFVRTERSSSSNCRFIKRSGKVVCSSASGRYQMMDFTFQRLKSKGWIKNFSSDHQDVAAVYLIYEKGALDDVLEGRFEKAACKVGSVWASFPCNSYKQPQKTIAQLKMTYNKQLGLY